MVRVRRVSTALVASVAVLALAGCGGGTPQQGPTTFSPAPTTGLAALLETPPAASVPGSSDWAHDYTPSVGQYVDEFYGTSARSRVRAELASQQLQDVAHVLWITDDNIQSDTVVLRFAAPAGAAAQFAFLRKTNEGIQQRDSYTIDAPGTPIVYFDTKAGKEGFRLARVYAQPGRYVVEMFVYSPGDVPRAKIEQWLRAQLTRLG